MSAGFPVPQNEVIDLTGNVLAIDDVIIDGQSIEEFVTDLQDVEEAVVEINEELAELTASTTIYPSRAAAEAATIPSECQVIKLLHRGVVLSYYRDPTGTALTTAGGVNWKVADSFHSPLHFGAVADAKAGPNRTIIGTDDGAAINAALAAYKAHNAESPRGNGSHDFDLLGFTYITGQSLNGTGMDDEWGWAIRNGAIVGKCTGKAVLDLTGSRGGELHDLLITGDINDTPSVGIQAARVVGHNQCSNCLWSGVHVSGWFSTVGVWCYGQETTTYLRCSFWNFHPEGAAGFHVGTDNFEYNGVQPMLMQSDYQTVITGDTSYINDKYINCDWRYSASGRNFNVTDITTTDPVVVTTATAHNFEIGDLVIISSEDWNTNGIYGIRGNVTEVTSTTVTIDVDGTGWPEYPGTGASILLAQTGPTLIVGRGNDHDFDSCYVVSYGDHACHIVFGGLNDLKQYNLDFLFEGAGTLSCYRFMTYGADNRGITGGSIRTYQSRVRDSVISTDATDKKIYLIGVDVSVPSARHTTPTVFDDESKYVFLGGDLTAYAEAAIVPQNFNVFSGQLSFVDTRRNYSYGNTIVGEAFRRANPGTDTIITRYRDATGAVKGSISFIPSSSVFGWAPTGTDFQYSLGSTAFYPTTTNAYNLGLTTRYWQNAYVTNGRFENIYASGSIGVSGSFTSDDGKTVTVTKGIITAIV